MSKKERNKKIVGSFKYLLPIVRGRLLRNEQIEAAKDESQVAEFKKILHYLEHYTKPEARDIPDRRAKEVLRFWDLHRNPAFKHWSLKQKSVFALHEQSWILTLKNAIEQDY